MFIESFYDCIVLYTYLLINFYVTSYDYENLCVGALKAFLLKVATLQADTLHLAIRTS